MSEVIRSSMTTIPEEKWNAIDWTDGKKEEKPKVVIEPDTNEC